MEFLFLQIEATEAATKVSNPLAMVCFIAAVVFALFGALRSRKSEDKTMLYVASGLALALCIIGAVTYSYTFQDHKPELDALQIKYNSLDSLYKLKIKESGAAETVEKQCAEINTQLIAANAKVTELMQQITLQQAEIAQLKSRTEKGDGSLLALDGRPYGFVQNYAVVKNKKGMWGYLHRGQFISKVDFVYKAACRFYSGMAGVQNSENKWGFVNNELDLAIPFRYEDAYGFDGDRAKVKLNGEWIWINKKGEQIIDEEAK